MNHLFLAPVAGITGGGWCPYCSGRKVLKGFNDLATTHPEIAESWARCLDEDKNPSNTSAGSKAKVLWECPQEGHQFLMPVYRRTKGDGCPYCSGRKVLIGFNDLATTHPEIAAEWCGDKSEPAPEPAPTEVSAGSNKTMTWSCEHGHVWSTSPKSRTRGHGCPVCSHNVVATGEGDLASVRPDVAALWRHPVDAALGDVTVHTVSPSSNIDVEWECELGHVFTAKPYELTRLKSKKFCPYCGGRKLLRGFNDLATTHPEIARTFAGDERGM